MRIPHHRRGERGQTIALVAVSIVSLLAMAALAIDVVSLYVAKSEVQRAADAAALAGAQAIANSGVTTLAPTDPNLAGAETLATSMANAAITAIVSASPSVNLVAGSAPTEATGSPSFNFTPNNNPTVTVTLQQPNLPTFFSKIWGSQLVSTSATATAEAYNPANATANPYTSIAPRCVKPWLVGNVDPGSLGAPTGLKPFVDVASGAVTQTDLIGEGFFLHSDCPLSAGCSSPTYLQPSVQAGPSGPVLDYVPTNVTYHAAPVMYPSCAVGEPDPTYTEAIEGCDPTPYACGGPTNTTSCTPPLNCWDPSVNPGFAAGGNQNSDSAVGAQCLIHSSAIGAPPPPEGQDTLSWPNAFPTGPPQILAGGGPQSGSPVTTSPSIVTIPIIDTSSNLLQTPPEAVTVVGFLQAFIDYVNIPPAPPAGQYYDVHVTLLNVSGCGANSAGTPVVGGYGTSPVPVRLITPP